MRTARSGALLLFALTLALPSFAEDAAAPTPAATIANAEPVASFPTIARDQKRPAPGTKKVLSREEFNKMKAVSCACPFICYVDPPNPDECVLTTWEPPYISPGCAYSTTSCYDCHCG